MFAAGALATLIAATLVLLQSLRASWNAVDRVVRWWAAVWLRTAGARISVHGLAHIRTHEAYVVVSNHQSSLDPMVHLQALPLSLRFLAKRELFQVPVLNRAMRAVGMIPVDRRTPDLPGIDAAAARCLAAGHSLLIYPEGGVSADETVRAFKDGAFVIAVANQVPILPVTIHGTATIWRPPRTAIHPGHVHVVIGEPLSTSQLTQHEVKELRDRARDTIRSTHRDLVRSLSPGATTYPATSPGSSSWLSSRRRRVRRPDR